MNQAKTPLPEIPDPFYLGDEAEALHYEELRKSIEAAKNTPDLRKRFERKVDVDAQARKFLAHGDPEKTGIDPKKPKRVSHDARAKEFFESRGFFYHKAEHYNAFSGRKHDFLGIFDSVAFNPEKGIVGIQITTTENVSARRKKMRSSDALTAWLAAGGKACILSFRKESNRWVPVLEVLK